MISNTEFLPRGAHSGYLPRKIANVVHKPFNQKVVVVRCLLCRSLSVVEYGFGIKFDFKLMFLVLRKCQCLVRRILIIVMVQDWWACRIPEDQGQLRAARPG